MSMSVQQANAAIIAQLADLVRQLSAAQMSTPLPLLSGNSLGKHLRHIVEFYRHLAQAAQEGRREVDYDTRPRQAELENCPRAALAALGQVAEALARLGPDRPITLQFSTSAQGHRQPLATSLHRELAYNLEHAVHHMAIIKMAVAAHFANIALPPHFGVAFATLQYQKGNGST